MENGRRQHETCQMEADLHVNATRLGNYIQQGELDGQCMQIETAEHMTGQERSGKVEPKDQVQSQRNGGRHGASHPDADETALATVPAGRVRTPTRTWNASGWACSSAQGPRQ